MPPTSVTRSALVYTSTCYACRRWTRASCNPVATARKIVVGLWGTGTGKRGHRARIVPRTQDIARRTMLVSDGRFLRPTGPWMFRRKHKSSYGEPVFSWPPFGVANNRGTAIRAERTVSHKNRVRHALNVCTQGRGAIETVVIRVLSNRLLVVWKMTAF